MVTAISTDLGNTAVFPALCTGGTLVLVSPATAADAAAAAAYLRAHPIDVLKITPVASQRAARRRRRRGRAAAALARLRRRGALLGPRRARARARRAAGSSTTTARRRRRSAPARFLVEERGAVAVRRRRFRSAADREHRAATCSTSSGSCVPEGVPASCYIAGAGVARGYVGQPELTERALPARSVRRASGRMYATGDSCAVCPDGTLEFLGRGDDQVKIRGFRVEPARSRQRCGATRACARPWSSRSTDARGERRLVAYVVAPSESTTDELRRHLAEWVPEYMIPSALRPARLAAATASGKVDRLALPAPQSGVDAGARPDYVAPRTPVEEAVAAIWADVLGVERVGVEDDFFALGGHSLLATQIVAQVRSDFSIDLPLHASSARRPSRRSRSRSSSCSDESPRHRHASSLLAELEGLSDEEVARLLAARTNRREARGVSVDRRKPDVQRAAGATQPRAAGTARAAPARAARRRRRESARIPRRKRPVAGAASRTRRSCSGC